MEKKLSVVVVDVEHLLVKCDPVVVLRCGYQFHWSSKKQTSKITKGVTSACFDETFQFDVEDPLLSLIHVQVYHKEISKELMGEAYYPVSLLTKDHPYPLKLNLVIKSSIKGRGFVNLVLHAFNFGKEAPPPIVGKHSLTLHHTESVPIVIEELNLQELLGHTNVNLENNQIVVVDPFETDELVPREDLSIDLKSYNQSAYLCMLLCSFTPVNIASSAQLAKPLFEVSKELEKFANILQISQATHESLFLKHLFLGRYGLEHLKYRRTHVRAKKEDFRTIDHFTARVEIDNKCIEGLIENMKTVSKSSKTLFVRIIEAKQDTKKKYSFTDVFCSITVKDGKKETTQKTTVIKDSWNPVWNEDFVFDLSNIANTSTIKVILILKNKQSNVCYGKLTVPLSDVITQQQQRWQQPVLGWTEFKTEEDTKLHFGIHFTERIVSEKSGSSEKAIMELESLEVNKIFQILTSQLGLGDAESLHKWILKDFCSRFGIHPVYQKLLTLEERFSNFDPEFVENSLSLLAGFQNMDNFSWSREEDVLYVKIKEKAEKQIVHILVHFMFYFSKLAAKDIKGMITSLEFINNNNNNNNKENPISTESILVNCFRLGAEKSYPIFKGSSKLSIFSIIHACTSLEQILTKRNDVVERISVIFETCPNPVDVSIQMYDTLLYNDMMMLLMEEDHHQHQPSNEDEEETKSKQTIDPSQVLHLYRIYDKLVKLFRERSTRQHKSFPYHDLFDPWIGKWLESTQDQLLCWIEKALENDKWKPLSNTVLYSCAVISLKQCIYQNLETICQLRKNKNLYLPAFTRISCSLVISYSTKLSEIIMNQVRANQSIRKWSDVGFTLPVDFTTVVGDDVNLTCTPELCVQFNNLFTASNVIQELEETIKEHLSEDILQSLKNDLLQPCYQKLKEIQSFTVNSAINDVMKIDVSKLLIWYVDSRATCSTIRDDPLFGYLNSLLEILSQKVEFVHFRTLLKEVFSVVIESINFLLTQSQNEGFFTILTQNQRVKTSEMIKRFNELLPNLCTWVEGNGEGLTQRVIERIARLITVRLQFWDAPSEVLIITHQNYEELSFEISKNELFTILESRENDTAALNYIESVKASLSLPSRLTRSLSAGVSKPFSLSNLQSTIMGPVTDASQRQEQHQQQQQESGRERRQSLPSSSDLVSRMNDSANAKSSTTRRNTCVSTTSSRRDEEEQSAKNTTQRQMNRTRSVGSSVIARPSKHNRVVPAAPAKEGRRVATTEELTAPPLVSLEKLTNFFFKKW